MSILRSLRDTAPYSPTTWAAGDLITAAKLNNVETGIQEALALLPDYDAEDNGKVLTVDGTGETPVLAWTTPV